MAYKIDMVEVYENGVLLRWEDIEARFILKNGNPILIGKIRMEGGDCWIPDLVFEEMVKKAAAILNNQQNRRNQKNNKKNRQPSSFCSSILATFIIL